MPVREINCTRRATSTSATQALALINGDFVTAQAVHFAERVLAGGGGELDTLLTFLRRQGSHYEGKPDAERRKRAFADFCQALFGANEFVYVD